MNGQQARVRHPVYEVKCYDLVVIEFTSSHNEADGVYHRSTANHKQLTRIDPDGRRVVLQQVRKC